MTYHGIRNTNGVGTNYPSETPAFISSFVLEVHVAQYFNLSFCRCVVGPSIYGFSLPLLYLQTLRIAYTLSILLKS
jgi:hypothetical protein